MIGDNLCWKPVFGWQTIPACSVGCCRVNRPAEGVGVPLLHKDDEEWHRSTVQIKDRDPENKTTVILSLLDCKYAVVSDPGKASPFYDCLRRVGQLLTSLVPLVNLRARSL